MPIDRDDRDDALNLHWVPLHVECGEIEKEIDLMFKLKGFILKHDYFIFFMYNTM